MLRYMSGGMYRLPRRPGYPRRRAPPPQLALRRPRGPRPRGGGGPRLGPGGGDVPRDHEPLVVEEARRARARGRDEEARHVVEAGDRRERVGVDDGNVVDGEPARPLEESPRGGLEARRVALAERRGLARGAERARDPDGARALRGREVAVARGEGESVDVVDR